VCKKALEVLDDKNLISIFELWDKYEHIAMHFNDLILKIRIQALAAVTAIITIVGILGKTTNTSTSDPINWLLFILVFFFLGLFWIAIWILDFRYYSRLLGGAVEAIKNLETLSQKSTHIQAIEFSVTVDKAIKEPLESSTGFKELINGRWLFYEIVFLGLVIGFILSILGHTGCIKL
jgi:hypothetical protein